MGTVSVFFAFSAGVLSFFSPCIFPSLPADVANLTNAQITDRQVTVSRLLLLIRSFGFMLGFSLIFTVMGASASLLGQLFFENRRIIEK